MQAVKFSVFSRRAALCAGVALAVLGGAGSARATEFTADGWEVNLDTTLTSNAGIRTSSQDKAFIGIANGGTFGSANADNGDLNFKRGDFVEATQRITTELQAKKDDYGFFIRATGFYDPIYDSNVNGSQFKLNRAAVRDIGADLRLLDAYAFFRPEVFGQSFDVRVGNQALNWGESTFYQFGINSITPLDATALRTPGAELRTAFLPIPALDVKTELTPDITLEGFWQPYWTRDKLEPVGSFFSTGDALFDGGKFSNFFSYYKDVSQPGTINIGDKNYFGATISQSGSRYPTGLGEFGFALRANFPDMNDLELGLYFENYNSRTPFASFKTGSANIGPALFGPGSQVLPSPIGALLGGTTATAHTYSNTDSFFADYPKDIKLIGFSWNFTAPGGVAIQGEASERIGQPLQLAASDLAAAVNAPAVCLLATNAVLGAQAAPVCDAYRADTVIKQLGGVANFNSIINGWVRRDVTQVQTTATKLFSAIPDYDINSIALVGEVGADYVDNFGKYRGLYNASYSTSDNSAFAVPGTVDTQPVPGTNYTVGHLSRKGLATPFSAAYTILAIIDMPAVLPYGIGMKPTFTFQHDFAGTSPVGVNLNVANTAAASAGVTFSYLQAWTLNVQYTNHFPMFAGGKFYGLIDRDFASATLSYEF